MDLVDSSGDEEDVNDSGSESEENTSSSSSSSSSSFALSLARQKKKDQKPEDEETVKQLYEGTLRDLEETLSQVEELMSGQPIEGLQKLKGRLTKELRSLVKSQQKGTTTVGSLKSANSAYYRCVMTQLRAVREAEGVLQVSRVLQESHDERRRVLIDLVVVRTCDGATFWVKCKARSSESLERAYLEGDASNVLSQAKRLRLLACSRHAVLLYAFSQPLSPLLQRKFAKLEVLYSIGSVLSRCLQPQSHLQAQTHSVQSRAHARPQTQTHQMRQSDLTTTVSSSSSSFLGNFPFLRGPLTESCSSGALQINLDVSAMLSLTSVTSHWTMEQLEEAVFQDPALLEQRRNELGGQRVLEIARGRLEGAALVVCRAAHESYVGIVSKIAGETERQLAEQLLALCSVVPDPVDHPLYAQLTQAGTKRLADTRNALVFATGAALSMPTLTTNVSYVRSALHSGIHLKAVILPARALSEEKKR